jgi:PGF-pre-PGF domain-containing protein
VVNISFDSKKTVGKTTTIVEMLKNQSTLVSEPPSDEIYKFINIWVGSGGVVTPDNIENAVVNFKVEKSWVQDKNIDKSSITLNRYSDAKWNTLSTNLTGEDDKYLYFTAQTPGFSPFAITGKAANEAVNPTPSETQTGPNIGSLENNARNATNEKQTSEQTQNTSTTGSGNKKTPGFEMISGIIGLFAVLIYKRK